MLLDALMQEDDQSDIDYAKLKEKAHDRKTLLASPRKNLPLGRTHMTATRPTIQLLYYHHHHHHYYYY